MHTYSKCKACYKHYFQLQMTYPQGPYYEESIVSIDTEGLRFLGEKGTQQALAEINASFTNTFDCTFSTLLTKHDKELQKKPTALEKKRNMRSIVRRFRDQENHCLKKATAITVLTEDESQRGYQRKRKSQYFETPPCKKSKVKSHSPDFTNVSWNKEVLHDLQQYPPPINWQKFARDHDIHGCNAGQVVKEFAQKSRIDTTQLDG